VQAPDALPTKGLAGRRRYWSRERCLETLVRFVAQRGRLPLRAEWRRAKENALPSLAAIRRLWDGIDDLYKAGGY
jgi:hypothetical protein